MPETPSPLTGDVDSDKRVENVDALTVLTHLNRDIDSLSQASLDVAFGDYDECMATLPASTPNSPKSVHGVPDESLTEDLDGKNEAVDTLSQASLDVLFDALSVGRKHEVECDGDLDITGDSATPDSTALVYGYVNCDRFGFFGKAPSGDTIATMKRDSDSPTICYAGVSRDALLRMQCDFYNKMSLQELRLTVLMGKISVLPIASQLMTDAETSHESRPTSPSTQSV